MTWRQKKWNHKASVAVIERARLEKAVTKLVEGIWNWQNKHGVITLTPSLRLGTILEGSNYIKR